MGPPFYIHEKFRSNDACAFENELQKMKCKYFCFLGPNPRKSGPAWTGRAFCNFSHIMGRLTGEKNTWERIPVIPKG